MSLQDRIGNTRPAPHHVATPIEKAQSCQLDDWLSQFGLEVTEQDDHETTWEGETPAFKIAVMVDHVSGLRLVTILENIASTRDG